MRSTDDFDFIVLADKPAIERVEARLLAQGFTCIRRQDSGEASGPDFVRMVNAGRDLFIDLQTAKTDYQELVVERAVATTGGVRLATAEDVIVLKLIAFRGIDQRDLIQLLKRDDLDWAYIERWARTWDVLDKLQALRDLLARDAFAGPG